MKTRPTLKEWLKITGKSYESFAKQCGFKSRQALERIVNLKDKPKFETIMKIWMAADYEFSLVSIWPDGARMWPTIQKIKKEDLGIKHNFEE